MPASTTSLVKNIKDWGFRSLLALGVWSASTILSDIKQDVTSLKEDVKTLLAQTNIDKTKIEQLQKDVDRLQDFSNKPTAKIPEHPAVPPPQYVTLEAVRPEDYVFKTSKEVARRSS